MLLYIIFLSCITIAAANYDVFQTFLNDFSLENENQEYHRFPRQAKKRDDFEIETLSCSRLWQTSRTPFIVLVLYKTSGRFVGMGSILDKRTILTASKVVENTLHSPRDLLILAGRFSPWWGKNSQVKKVMDINVNDVGLALMRTEEAFTFNKYIAPVKIPIRDVPEFSEVYGTYFVVFGIPRSSWDVPGDLASKSSVYLMKVELLLEEKKFLDPCKKHYPDRDFNETIDLCTSANGTYCWGCIGSPTIAIDKNEKILQVAVVTKTTTSETDYYHVHTKVAPFDKWLRSQNVIGFDPKK